METLEELIKNKIEESAKHYAEENSMSIEDQMGDVYDGIEELSDAYKAGAKWAINELFKNLWNPASKEPRKDVSIIVKKHIMTRICFTMLGTDSKITFIHRGLTQFFVVGFLVGFILMIYFQRKEVNND